ncbi:hypothetical protein NLI96_g6461 [Meripilus lineatus]|uniref:DUF6533 domain-containing protein n=1 Tax=Meripilus lineatus TaxID=2056292 RepID=A0AAD5YI19_9APHY|nr:hypothetical protein NLI96_g6461 [Physisporinus lineatus]
MNDPDSQFSVDFERQGIRYCRVSVLALFAYEMLITLDEEVETIWKRRINLPSILYLVMRFGTLGYLIINALQTTTFFGLQTNVGYVNLTTCFYSIAQHLSGALFKFTLVMHYYWWSYLPFVAYFTRFIDAVASDDPLHQVSGVCDFTIGASNEFIMILSTILYTRFFLNLRNVDNVQTTSGDVPHTSSLKFASSVIGNIGAPLNISKGTTNEWSDADTQQDSDPSSIDVSDVLPSHNERDPEGGPSTLPTLAQ